MTDSPFTSSSERETAGWPLRLAVALTLAGSAALFVMVIVAAVPAMTRSGAGGPFSWTWRPYQGVFGILPMLCASLLLAVFALLPGWPLALGLCCWMETESGKCVRVVRSVLRLMTAIPTVVYGFSAVFLLTPLVRSWIGGTGMCVLSAGLMLVMLVLPTMTLVLEAGIAPRLERLWPYGMALGMSRGDLLWRCVLPESRKTLVTAAVLGFGRAAGDTLLPLMLAGNAPQLPHGLSSSLRALTAHMSLVTANEVGGAAYDSLFVAGALLLGMNAAVSLLLRRLGAKP